MNTVQWLLIVPLVLSVGLLDGSDDGSARSQQPGTPPVVLSDGFTIAQRAAHGDKHRYEVWLNAGDFFELSVSQHEFRVTVALQGPGNELLLSVNFPNIEPLPERVLFVASVSGRYGVQVSVDRGDPIAVGLEREPQHAATEPRTYSLQVLAMRPGTPSDLSRARWFGVLERAASQARLGTMDGLRQAIPLYSEAASGWRSIGDLPLEAATLEALATLTAFFTQFARDSAAARERLTELYERMGDSRMALSNWRSLAVEYGKLGRLAGAKTAMERGLELAGRLGLRVNAARAYRELGYYEFELGNFTRAGELAREAYELAVAIPDRTVQALTLYDLARLDELTGDFQAALARNKEALALASGHRGAAAVIMMWLGFTHLARGELEEAAVQFEARLEFGRTFIQRDQEALSRLGLGDVMRARGDRPGARQRYEVAAAALEGGAQPYRCIAEQRLARMDLEDGRLDEAEARFQRMIEIAAKRSSPQCEAEARSGFADVAARRGELEIADVESRRVLELSEAFREAATSLESRSLGFGALAPAYERAIDISMRRAQSGDIGGVARAFAFNEQALARALLDRLLETRLAANARVPAALATAHATARERWRSSLAELQVAIRIRPDADETKALAAEVDRLAIRARDLEAQIDAADARQASFIRPRPLTLAGAQALLDDDTVLLEYALGVERSYLWVVSPREIRAFTLGPRAKIEALAKRVHDRLARSPVSAADEWVRQDAASEERSALTRLVIEPAAPFLTGKRLVVVLPGALSLIPFGALPQPGRDGAAPMIDGHEIVQVPSATTLATTRALTTGRSRPTRTAAIFADPIFDTHDPRVGRSSSSKAPTNVPAAVQRSGTRLSRLPFSRGEAKAIASLAPRRVTTFLGSDASRDRALDRALFDYRFIHFATHSIVNQEVPSLSSLVLSLVDVEGRPRDGLVMLPDIYDMTLNADLVVLSGCQTALGKPVQGEGPIGLARAFMYAGVPRVVASLWLVDDLATAELMKRFYSGILIDGLAPAAALRRAQRELAANPRWKSPYFWAPFVLQGDWR